MGSQPSVVIIAPKGSSGAYIENLANSEFRKQREFLIGPNSSLRKLYVDNEITLYLLEK